MIAATIPHRRPGLAALDTAAKAWEATQEAQKRAKEPAVTLPPAIAEAEDVTALLAPILGQAIFSPRRCEACQVAIMPHNLGTPTQPVYRWLSRYCDPCVEIQKREARATIFAEHQDKEHRRIEKLWETFGPEGQNNTENIYREADPAKVKNKRVTIRALEWTPGRKTGLMLAGDTGTSKTFTVYLIAKQCVFQHGVLPTLWLAPALRHKFNVLARSDDEHARGRFLNELIHTRVLIIDDIGQAASTEAAEEALYEVIEGRVARSKPIIVTTQFMGERFIAKFKNRETGVAILRRLGEHTTPLNTDFQ